MEHNQHFPLHNVPTTPSLKTTKKINNEHLEACVFKDGCWTRPMWGTAFFVHKLDEVEQGQLFGHHMSSSVPCSLSLAIPPLYNGNRRHWQIPDYRWRVQNLIRYCVDKCCQEHIGSNRIFRIINKSTFIEPHQFRYDWQSLNLTQGGCL